MKDIRAHVKDGADEHAEVMIKLCLNDFWGVLYAGHRIVSAQAGISTALLQRQWKAEAHSILKRKQGVSLNLTDRSCRYARGSKEIFLTPPGYAAA